MDIQYLVKVEEKIGYNRQKKMFLLCYCKKKKKTPQITDNQ